MFFSHAKFSDSSMLELTIASRMGKFNEVIPSYTSYVNL